jgi:hypothetical protein
VSGWPTCRSYPRVLVTQVTGLSDSGRCKVWAISFKSGDPPTTLPYQGGSPF